MAGEQIELEKTLFSWLREVDEGTLIVSWEMYRDAERALGLVPCDECGGCGGCGVCNRCEDRDDREFGEECQKCNGRCSKTRSERTRLYRRNWRG